MDALPPTPTRPIDVRITFVQAFNGEHLGTHTLRMVEGMSVAILFQLVKYNPVTDGRHFSLALGGRVWNYPGVWNYPSDEWEVFVGDRAVQDAIEANTDNAPEVCVRVIFVSSPRPVESRE